MVCLNTKYVESFRRTKSARHSEGVAYWRNVLNRLSSITDPLANSEYYEYDEVSNLKSEKLPSGALVYFEYDALNRQTAIEYPNDPASYYSYDPNSNLSNMSDSHGTTYFEYDAVNRLTGELTPYGGEVYYSYDAVSRRSILESSAGDVYYAYDAASRQTGLKTISSSAGGWGTQAWGSSPWGGGGGGGAASNTYYEYDSATNLMKKTLNNGVFTYFSYDAANRVSDIKNCKSDGTPIAYFEYNYDAASRIDRITREDGTNVYYTYDNANRLTSEKWLDSGNSEIYAFEWDYDAVGNRTYENFNSAETYYTYDVCNRVENGHELASGYSYFGYDSNGNMTQWQRPSGTTYFEYNDAQLIDSIHYSNGSWNYFYYDAMLRRYAINDSFGLQYFTWDQNGANMLAETNSSGTVTAKYVNGYSAIGEYSRAQTERIVSDTSYFQYDIRNHLDSTYRILDANENIVGSYEYNAYGKILSQTNPPEGARHKYGPDTWIALDDPDNLGLYLTPYGIYSAVLGRYIQEDPLPKVAIRRNLGIYEHSIFAKELFDASLRLSRNAIGLNLYSYVSNNPISLIDCFGLYPELEGPFWDAVGNALFYTGNLIFDPIYALYAAIVNIGKFEAGLPQRLLSHYMFGNGGVFKITKNEIITQLKPISTLLRDPKFKEVIYSGGGILDGTYTLFPSQTRLNGSLGNFVIKATVTGCAESKYRYYVSGTAIIIDTWDFDWNLWEFIKRQFGAKSNNLRSWYGQFRAMTGSGIPGTPFHVMSEKVKIWQDEKHEALQFE